MDNTPAFQLYFVRKQTHLLLPLVSSIRLAQTLYDILFQYAITPEKELRLNKFIKDLEQHIKSKSTAPYSLPMDELDFLEEGLEELQLLNWLQVPTYEFRLTCTDCDEEQFESLVQDLNNVMVCAWQAERQLLYVYPQNMV